MHYPDVYGGVGGGLLWAPDDMAAPKDLPIFHRRPSPAAIKAAVKAEGTVTLLLKPEVSVEQDSGLSFCLAYIEVVFRGGSFIKVAGLKRRLQDSHTPDYFSRAPTSVKGHNGLVI